MNTTYFLNQVMGNVFGTQTTPALPEKYWIGLSSTAPTVEGDNVTEPVAEGSGYHRVHLNNLSAPVLGVIRNNGAVAFPESESEWGTMTHYVVYDEESGGNLLFYGELEHSRLVEIETTLLIKDGELVITLENKTAE